MKSCDKADRILEALMSTDSGDDERQEILRHTRECDSCRETYRVHEDLESMTTVEPVDSDLLQVRRGVLRSLRAERAAGLSKSDWSWLGPAALRPSLVAASTVALLALGFVAGRGGVGSRDTGVDAITGSIERVAAHNLELAQSVESPFVYSNVRLQAIDDETVRLGFDVATHLELTRPRTDPLVSEVLVHSLVNPAPLGTRLNAIELAGSVEPKVRDALIVAMLEDPDLAVRLRAISKLTGNDSDRATQEALLDVLRNEASVTMRLLAIEHLTINEVSPQALQAAIEQGRPEPGTAVYAKAEEYLRVF